MMYAHVYGIDVAINHESMYTQILKDAIFV